MKLYVVQNREGQYFRPRGYGGYGNQWQTELGKAKFYSKMGTAKSQCTFWFNANPDLGCPKILEFVIEAENAFRSLCGINGANASIEYPVEWDMKKDSLPVYVDYPEVFRNISWGGDTKEIKLKEKEELESTFNMLLMMKTKYTDQSILKAYPFPDSKECPETVTLSNGYELKMEPYDEVAAEKNCPTADVVVTMKVNDCPSEVVVNGIVVDNPEKEEKMES